MIVKVGGAELMVAVDEDARVVVTVWRKRSS